MKLDSLGERDVLTLYHKCAHILTITVYFIIFSANCLRSSWLAQLSYTSTSTKTMASSEFPWQHSFPPFYTLQPHQETKRKQLEAWRSIVLGK